MGRVVEVDRNGKTVWEKGGMGRPYDVHRLRNGHTLIAGYSGNNLVMKLDKSGRIVKKAKLNGPLRAYK